MRRRTLNTSSAGHWQRSYAYQAQLFDKFPAIRDQRTQFSGDALRDLKDRYEKEVDRRFPWRTRMKLNQMWVWLNLGVVGAGAVLTLLVALQ